MTITREEAHKFSNMLFRHQDDWKANSDTLQRFTKWFVLDWDINKDTMDLPVEFQKFYRLFQALPDYKPSGKSLELELDRMANPPAYKPPRGSFNPGKSFLEQFEQLTRPTKSAFERLEALRRGPSESELQRAVRLALKSAALERRDAEGDPIRAVLADPEQKFYWDSMCRILGGGKVWGEQAELLKALRSVKGLDPSTSLGSVLFPVPVSTDVYDLLLTYGAFRALGVRPMASTKTKFAKLTGLPITTFITPTATGSGRVIVTDIGGLSGNSLTQQVNVITALIEASQEVLEDEKADLGDVLLRAFVQGLASRIDYACFQGNGTDDIVNGAQTGIFVDTSITAVSAVAGHDTVGSLVRQDFISVIGAVAPAALQRPCRWFINPALIPSLLPLQEGTGPSYLLKTPAETGGEWHLVGFPVTWAAQAPSAVTAGSKIAAFGEPNSYLIGVREDFELGMAAGAKFAQNIRLIRCLARARCDLREATGLATFKLATP